MKSVNGRRLVARYKAKGWKKRVAMYAFDPYLDEEAYLEALRRARLYVSDTHEQARRITVALRSVWLSLPVPVRIQLMSYWREHIPEKERGSPDVFLLGMPTIEIADNFHATASTNEAVYIGFNGRVIERMDDLVLQDVVAHEFGHAWSYTFDDSIIRQYNNDTHWHEIEWEADMAADYWGRIGKRHFSMRRLRAWGQENDKLVKQMTGRSGMWTLKPLNELQIQPIDPAHR